MSCRLRPKFLHGVEEIAGSALAAAVNFFTSRGQFFRQPPLRLLTDAKFELVDGVLVISTGDQASRADVLRINLCGEDGGATLVPPTHPSFKYTYSRFDRALILAGLWAASMMVPGREFTCEVDGVRYAASNGTLSTPTVTSANAAPQDSSPLSRAELASLRPF